MGSDLLVHVQCEGRKELLRVPEASSLAEVRSAFAAAANVADASSVVLKLYNKDNVLLPIGPHLKPNSASTAYKLVVLPASKLPDDEVAAQRLAEMLKATNEILGNLPDLQQNVVSIKDKMEPDPSSQLRGYTVNDPAKKPAMLRVSKIPMDRVIVFSEQPKPTFRSEVLEHLKHPTFDMWQWSDAELVALMEHMYVDMGLVEAFNIDRGNLTRFLNCIRVTYNQNPFHNFQHCFCVTQMMYGIIHVTGLHTKLTLLEKLVLLISTMGHDLDHPGLNNAYQINACTDLAIVYNDISPLENHHAAVLFTIMRDPKLNILSGLSDAQYKEVRKNVISCILATDMAKHGEILAKFRTFADNFNFEDAAQRQLLLQLVTKCSDISNEVRPKHVSEPWVDNLLNEFFGQSDKEKAEGLPTAPFMDREKVTKPSAQVGFIGFVMIPLYELVAKVLPNMEEPILQPIRKAHEYYKSMLPEQNQITFVVLVSEIILFLLSLIPLNFVPVRSRKAFMQWSAKALGNETVVWSARIILLLVAGVFVDTVLRLQKLDSSLHGDHDHHRHSPTESTLEDLQYKTKLFYSQRNMYLSLTSLFLVVVLYRRMKDIYAILQLQEELESSKTTLKALKAQVEILVNAKETTNHKDAKTTQAPAAPTQAVSGSKDEIEMDPLESSGIRKRK